jgi:hypothetical protein
MTEYAMKPRQWFWPRKDSNGLTDVGLTSLDFVKCVHALFKNDEELRKNVLPLLWERARVRIVPNGLPPEPVTMLFVTPPGGGPDLWYFITPAPGRVLDRRYHKEVILSMEKRAAEARAEFVEHKFFKGAEDEDDE